MEAELEKWKAAREALEVARRKVAAGADLYVSDKLAGGYVELCELVGQARAAERAERGAYAAYRATYQTT